MAVKGESNTCREQRNLFDGPTEPQEARIQYKQSGDNRVGSLPTRTADYGRTRLQTQKRDSVGGASVASEAAVTNQKKQQKMNEDKQKVLTAAEKREARLEYQRNKVASLRANETVAQREARLQCQRDRQNRKRATETLEEREARLQYSRCRNALLRATETAEQRRVRLQYQRYKNNLRKPTTEEEHEALLQYQRDRAARARATETMEMREARLEYHRNRVARRRAAETDEQREARRKYARERAAAIKAKKLEQGNITKDNSTEQPPTSDFHDILLQKQQP